MVLPSADVDTDEEGADELHKDEAHEDADFLADFPDDTQVCVPLLINKGSSFQLVALSGPRARTRANWVA